MQIKVESIEYGDDTIKYYLEFYRNNPSDRYVQKKADSFVEIAIVKHNNLYFPLLGETYFNSPSNYYEVFFDNRETLFIEFIKKYDGNISSSLKMELIKRNLLK